jgi:hypothetical protein
MKTMMGRGDDSIPPGLHAAPTVAAAERRVSDAGPVPRDG